LGTEIRCIECGQILAEFDEVPMDYLWFSRLRYKLNGACPECGHNIPDVHEYPKKLKFKVQERTLQKRTRIGLLLKKRLLTAVFVAMLLFSALAGSQLVHFSYANFFPDPGPDLPRIYIRNDGSVEPATVPIERTGNLYKLTNNIVLYTIEIQRDNIILDGAGHTIQGNASRIKGYDDGNNGVILAGRNNVTITRLNFEQGDTGVRISNSSHINITGNTFTNGLTTGIATKDSSLVLIEGNNFTSIYGPAILCNGTAHTIKGNTLTDGAYGIDLEGSSNLISDNKIEVLLPIIMDKADSNIIARNKISGPAPYLTHWPDRDQNFTGNEGIALFRDCSNNIIFGNNITGFVNQAIRITDGSNNTVYGNYMANNQFAIALGGFGDPANNTFYGNTFTADSCKIRINDVEGTFWDNGTIGNYWGDYNGTDSNGDGIGDTPHVINENIQDNYPLVNPFDITDIPEFPSWTPLLIMVVAVVAVAVIYRRRLPKNRGRADK
jgi:parallel beta-helix repeat protein